MEAERRIAEEVRKVIARNLENMSCMESGSYFVEISKEEMENLKNMIQAFGKKSFEDGTEFEYFVDGDMQITFYHNDRCDFVYIWFGRNDFELRHCE